MGSKGAGFYGLKDRLPLVRLLRQMSCMSVLPAMHGKSMVFYNIFQNKKIRKEGRRGEGEKSEI